LNQDNMDYSKLKGIVPDSVYNEIPTIVDKFSINTPLRLAHFLAQAGHESGEFKFLKENINYSEDGLKKIFPKYFPADTAKAYARNPEKIANKVYASRMGNGDEASGDGYKFRGRGYIQLTGKSNYKAFSDAIGEDCIVNPDLVATKYPLASAAWFFNKNCLSKADQGAADSAIIAVTKSVNGGTIGIVDRTKHFKHYHSILNV